jgi:hypothetical protein
MIFHVFMIPVLFTGAVTYFMSVQILTSSFVKHYINCLKLPLSVKVFKGKSRTRHCCGDCDSVCDSVCDIEQ